MSSSSPRTDASRTTTPRSSGQDPAVRGAQVIDLGPSHRTAGLLRPTGPTSRCRPHCRPQMREPAGQALTPNVHSNPTSPDGGSPGGLSDPDGVAPGSASACSTHTLAGRAPRRASDSRRTPPWPALSDPPGSGRRSRHPSPGGVPTGGSAKPAPAVPRARLVRAWPVGPGRSRPRSVRWRRRTRVVRRSRSWGSGGRS